MPGSSLSMPTALTICALPLDCALVLQGGLQVWLAYRRRPLCGKQAPERGAVVTYQAAGVICAQAANRDPHIYLLCARVLGDSTAVLQSCCQLV